MDANDLLRALLEATEHYEADPRHERWDGSFISFINASGLKPGLIGSFAGHRVTAPMIDDLADQCLVRNLPPQGAGVERKFAMTAEGRRRATALATPAVAVDAVDLAWPTLRARLSDFVTAYERAGAPEQGLQLDASAGAASHLRHLLGSGYLEETPFGTDQSTMARPTERAFVAVRNWPGAWSTAEDLVSGVVTSLQQRDDAGATGLRTVLASGGRDVLVEVVAAVLAKQSGIA